MQSVCEELIDLRACDGTNAKIAFLKKCSPDFQRYLVAVLDPYRMYGIKSYPTLTFKAEYSEPPEITSLFVLLDRLQAREITGNAAGNACSSWEAGGGVRELLTCALNKDLRAGVAATTVNKAIPGLIPEFKVALAEEYDPNNIEFPAFLSTKYDGLRALAFVDIKDQTVEFKTRNGLDIPAVSEELKKELLSLVSSSMIPDRYVFDGEILSGDFQESVSALRKKNRKAENGKYYIFDYLPEREFLNRASTQTQMTRSLGVECLFRQHSSKLVHRVVEEPVLNNEEVQANYQARIANGFEGVILKNPKALYQFRRSLAWMKIKEIKSYDLPIIGVEEGKGKYSGTLGALVGDYNGMPVRVSGMTDMQRNNFWTNPPIGQTMEIFAQGETKDKSLRHPRFVKIRMDK